MNDDIACGKIFHKPIPVNYVPWEDQAAMLETQAKSYQESGRDDAAREAEQAAKTLRAKRISGFLTSLTFDDVMEIRYHIRALRTRLEKRAALIPVEDRSSPDPKKDKDISETIATAYMHLVVWRALKADAGGRPGKIFFSSEDELVQYPEPVILSIYMDYLKTFEPSEEEMRPTTPAGVVH